MISRDGRLLFATYAVRMFAYGFLSVVHGPYLAWRRRPPGHDRLDLRVVLRAAPS
jgi:hypothetical protein